jgi:hypothetical protein
MNVLQAIDVLVVILLSALIIVPLALFMVHREWLPGPVKSLPQAHNEIEHAVSTEQPPLRRRRTSSAFASPDEINDSSIRDLTVGARIDAFIEAQELSIEEQAALEEVVLGTARRVVRQIKDPTSNEGPQ